MDDNVVIPQTGNADLDLKYMQWMEWDKNGVNRADIREMVADKRYDMLRACLMTRLEFGTAGLRGVMGPGFNAMNDLVVIQTSQGLAEYVLSSLKQGKMKSIVVGYDGRFNSRRFAELTTNAFVTKGFCVYLFSRMCPTPFVPFAVKLFGCQAGIMITASHNPKEDNGYKVYWENGAQIVSPMDKDIQRDILANLAPWENAWDCRLTTTPNTVDPMLKVMDEYYAILQDGCLYRDINTNCPIKFTYTPMHGVGQPFMQEAFAVAGFKKFVSVDKQMDANPEFPTVKFPNPEEGKSALDLAIQTADKFDSTIILANDPDADRLAVAERLNEKKDWKIFNGNEIGALLGWWSLYLHKNSENPLPLNKCVMIASTVSSKFLRTMADKEGFRFIETLTGFKWMGNKAFQLRKEGCKVLFAFEEAIGFMMGTAVLDKDGISAGIRLAELAAYLQTQGLTLNDKLNQLYDEYGYHVSLNSYYICHDPVKITKIFDRLRNYNPTQVSGPNYPKEIRNGNYAIVDVRDLTAGYDSEQPYRRPILPISKSSQMITFTFSNGLVATLRTSGTEPKIKYYTELRARPGEKDYDAIKEKLHTMVKSLVEEFLNPVQNELQPKSD